MYVEHVQTYCIKLNTYEMVRVVRTKLLLINVLSFFMYVSLELFSIVRIKFNAPHRNNVNVNVLSL